MQDTNWFKLAQEFLLWLGVVVLALLVGLYVPLLGLLTAGILAVPLVVFSIRYGARMGINLLIAIAIVLGLLLGNLVGIGFLCEFGVLSQALIFGFRRKFSNDKVILTAFVAVILAIGLLAIGTSSLSREKSLSKQINKQIDEHISQIIQSADTLEAEKKEIDMLRQTAEMVGAFMHKAYPGMYASITLLLIVSNCFVSKLVLIKMGYELADEAPFSKLVLPEFLVWGFIISASFTAVTTLSLLNSTFIQLLGLNFTLVFVALYLVQGLAIVVHLGERIRVPVFVKWIGIALLLIQPFFLLLIAGAGLFDTWFDLRKLKEKTIL